MVSKDTTTLRTPRTEALPSWITTLAGNKCSLDHVFDSHMGPQNDANVSDMLQFHFITTSPLQSSSKLKSTLKPASLSSTDILGLRSHRRRQEVLVASPSSPSPGKEKMPESLTPAMLMIEGPKFSAFNFSPDPSGSSAGEFLVINGHRILLPQKKATPLAESEKEITSGHQDEDNLTHTAKTAASVWDCSIVLSKYLEALAEKSPEYWNGKRVLELGAGQGIVSFSAAAVGARQVIITDIDSATQTLREGVALNGFEPSQVQVTALDWTNRAGALQHIRRDLLMASPQSRVPLDCILASDVVWVDYLIPDLVNTVADLIDNSMEEAWETFDSTMRSQRSTIFLLAYQFRSQRGDQVLFESLDRLKLNRKKVCLDGSETQDLDTVLLDPKFRKPNIAIWKIWKDEAL